MRLVYYLDAPFEIAEAELLELVLEVWHAVFRLILGDRDQIGNVEMALGGDKEFEEVLGERDFDLVLSNWARGRLLKVLAATAKM